MSGYAIDTNIISFLLRKNKKLQEKVYMESNYGQGVTIPPIAFYEVKRGLLDANATAKLSAFENLCSMLGVDDLDMNTLDNAASIYANLKKNGQLIEDADILIAASCVTHDYVLVTNNTKHFINIDGLQTVDWTSE
jgi:predicted nucleic acid-binding protein